MQPFPNPLSDPLAGLWPSPLGRVIAEAMKPLPQPGLAELALRFDRPSVVGSALEEAARLASFQIRNSTGLF